ncbi:tyrosine-type recombinase/integrase [Terriglobus sp. ADX1]|uniref:tyrosine-type recombinase/integrase n=1 Tax=Terriglobus sp. ADX1 TaxID=2794063 RepID=UPI003FCDFE09
MLSERQDYLGKLLSSGYQRQFVADRASTLCHIVTQGWLTGAEVTDDDIVSVLPLWIGEESPQDPKLLRQRGKYFIAVARHWTKYLHSYTFSQREECCFREQLGEFATWLRQDRGFSPSSIESCASELKVFLAWLTPRCPDLSRVSLTEIDAFIAERKSEGRSRHTIIGNCHTIRIFFRYAEERGWNHKNLSKTVRTPPQSVTECPPRCPPWKQVRTTLASLDTSNPSHIRARAILFLASVYGLRRSEIRKLTLEDFDWQNEILTVRRSKRGRTQQFPLQFEVGEAVIRYLRIRPKCNFRELFLTLHSPFRPAKNFSGAVRKILNAQKTFDRPWGMHAFRHACATELLRKGTSLRGIADFLGHRGIQSVSIYAHSDIRALREVAAIDLRGLLCV